MQFDLPTSERNFQPEQFRAALVYVPECSCSQANSLECQVKPAYMCNVAWLLHETVVVVGGVCPASSSIFGSTFYAAKYLSTAVAS